MTERQKAIDEFRHAVCGAWLDVVLGDRRGAELSMALRVAQKKTDELATRLYDDAAQTKPAANGAPAPPARK